MEAEYIYKYITRRQAEKVCEENPIAAIFSTPKD